MGRHDIILAVGLGGALGTVARYLLSLGAVTLQPGAAVLATLMANILGAGLIGYLATRPLAPRARAFLMTGFCGGFTTFSMVSLELVLLIERSLALAAAYAGVSLGAWMLAVWAGYRLGHARGA